MNTLNDSISLMLANDNSTNKKVLSRLVYLKPNRYSNEALTVGVLCSNGKENIFRYIASDSAYDNLSCLFGEENIEQVKFALAALNIETKMGDVSFKSFESQSDLLEVSEIREAETENMHDYAQDLLQLSSSLYRNYSCRTISQETFTQDQFKKQLYIEVSSINPFGATKLFRRKYFKTPDNNIKIELPIYGDNIIGSPFTFKAKKIAEAKNMAEAFIARCNYVREFIHDKEINVYILAPSMDDKVNQKIASDSFEELQFVARANGVNLKREKHIQELARVIMHDESNNKKRFV